MANSLKIAMSIVIISSLGSMYYKYIVVPSKIIVEQEKQIKELKTAIEYLTNNVTVSTISKLNKADYERFKNEIPIIKHNDSNVTDFMFLKN